MAKSVLTVCTKSCGPTVPFVSGGVVVTGTVPCGPVNPLPMRSKLFVGEGIALVPTWVWTGALRLLGLQWRTVDSCGKSSAVRCLPLDGFPLMELSGAETSLCTEELTRTFPPCLAWTCPAGTTNTRARTRMVTETPRMLAETPRGRRMVHPFRRGLVDEANKARWISGAW